MRNETWLAALDHELESRGVGATDRAAIVVEAETYLAEAGVPALDQFGSPADYGETLAQAVGASRVGPSDRRVGPPVVVAEGISKSYRTVPVLSDVSLTVGSADIVALVGPNGAGKSTLLRILAGLEQADQGRVRVDGTVGYVPQAGGLDPYLRPIEHVELFGAARGMSRTEARSEGARLGEMLGWNLTTAPIVAELSGGTRQKLCVITALIGDPAVLLMDEPYQGMDADSSRRFWEMLWQWGDGQGRAAVVSTHQTDVLSRARTVIELAEVGR